jgi:hypothetical protein
MDIDSVRELKQRLSTTLIPTHVFETRGVRALALTARSAGVLPRMQTGVALGIAPGRVKKDFRLAVRIQRRTLQTDSELLSTIKTSAKDEVDVRYVGRIAKAAATPWQQTKQRPLRIGSSIGHFDITAGTLGCFVTHPKVKGVCVLSNNHVLADENRAKVGDAILQPGKVDGGQDRDLAATLESFVSLKTVTHNVMDVAVAKVVGDVAFDLDDVEGFKRLKASVPDPVEPDLKVVKFGRTTGLTRGKVTATEVQDVTVAYESGDFTFDQVFEAEYERGPFGLGGDSGSVIMDEDGHARGLLFAVSDQGGRAGRGLTYATELNPILKELGITLATAG